jgi:hypothetical protein
MNEEQQPRLQLPDHTRIQLVAVVQAVIAVLVAFGAPISDQQSVALLALAGVLGTVLIGADASIRRERARNADKLYPQASLTRTEGPAGTQLTAELHGPVGPVDGSDDIDLDQEVVELLRRILRARDARPRSASAPRTARRERQPRRTATNHRR